MLDTKHVAPISGSSAVRIGAKAWAESYHPVAGVERPPLLAEVADYLRLLAVVAADDDRKAAAICSRYCWKA